MSKTQRKKDRYPKPFQSEWTDDGSRTIDLGQQFEVTVDDSGFSVYRRSGPWSVDDLFGELGYWPETVVWTGSAATLTELLKLVAKAAHVKPKKLLAQIVDELANRVIEQDIGGYLADERRVVKQRAELSALWQKWPTLQGSHQIPGMPSPEMWESHWATFDRRKVSPEDCCYNGLELTFGEGGWTARIYSDADNPPALFDPEMWTADTFDGLFSAEGACYFKLEDCLPWTRDELAEAMVRDDPRWRPFVASSTP